MKTKKLAHEISINFLEENKKIEVEIESTKEIEIEEFLKICFWFIEKISRGEIRDINFKKEIQNIKFYEHETTEITKKKTFDSEELILDWI